MKYSNDLISKCTLIGLLLLCMFWVVPESCAKEYQFEEQRVFAVEPASVLELNCFGGDIEVSGHDVDRVVLKVVRRIDAVSMDEARFLADNIVIKTAQERDRLTVNTNFLRKIKANGSLWGKLFGADKSDPYGAVDFVVLVPRGCSVEISNNTGNVKMNDLTGSVAIRSSASDIHLSAVEGSVLINNAGGKTFGEMLFGDVTVDQAMGSIELRWIEGDIRIRSQSADIDIIQEKGALDLTTATGNVNIQSYVYTGRDCFISTESGNINLQLPQSLSGTLHITSDLGNIRTMMPITIESISREKVVGQLGSGGVGITLKSTTGDVTVAEF